MAGPFAKHFYHERVRRYSRFLGAILSDMKVVTEGKTIRIPLEYLGGIRDQSSPVYSAGVLPVMTLKFVAVEVNSEKVQNSNRIENYGGSLQKRRLPVNLDFEWCIKVKKQDELFQLQEQILTAFYPTFDVKVMSDDETSIVENLKFYLTSYDFADYFEGNSEEANTYELTYMVRVEGGYFYQRTLNEAGSGDAYIIKEAIVNISTDPFTPFAGERTWFTLYEPTEVHVRFPSSLPLGNEEGAYDTPTDEPILVIGSSDWVREGYE